MSSKVRYSIKYEQEKNINQKAGALVLKESKIMLLSCKEFDSVVDNVMIKDGNTIVKKTIERQDDVSGIITTEEAQDVSVGTYADLEKIDTDLTLATSNPIAYEKFCKESRLEKLSTQEDTKKKFARKVNKLVSTHFLRGYINWNKYDDSTPDIKMDSSTIINLRNADVVYLAYFSEDEPEATKITHQLMLLYSLAHYGAKSITIVLPFFPVGTMERIVGEGEIPTGYAFAQMLNNIPSASGKNNLIVFDIHALASRFFFHTNLRPTMVSMLSYYLKYINDKYPESANNNNIIVFPDDGAKKRFEKQMPKSYKTILCSKERKGDDRIIKIEEGIGNIDLTGKTNNFFIIDDLIQSGGTSKETVHGIKTSIKKFIETSVATARKEGKPEPVVNNVEANKFKYFAMITHLVAPDANKFYDFIKPTSLLTETEKTKAERLELTVGEVEKLITTNTRPLRGTNIKKFLNDHKDASVRSLALGNKIDIVDISEIIHDVLINTKETLYIAPNIMI